MNIPAELREAVGQAAHAAYRAERARPLHAPEDCPCKDGHDEPSLPDQPAAIYVWCLRCHRQIERGTTGCPACRAGLRAWPNLSDYEREEFRASQDPALALLAPVLAECREVADSVLCLLVEGPDAAPGTWQQPAQDELRRLLARLAALGVTSEVKR